MSSDRTWLCTRSRIEPLGGDFARVENLKLAKIAVLVCLIAVGMVAPGCSEAASDKSTQSSNANGALGRDSTPPCAVSIQLKQVRIVHSEHGWAEISVAISNNSDAAICLARGELHVQIAEALRIRPSGSDRAFRLEAYWPPGIRNFYTKNEIEVGPHQSTDIDVIFGLAGTPLAQYLLKSDSWRPCNRLPIGQATVDLSERISVGNWQANRCETICLEPKNTLHATIAADGLVSQP